MKSLPLPPGFVMDNGASRPMNAEELKAQWAASRVTLDAPVIVGSPPQLPYYGPPASLTTASSESNVRDALSQLYLKVQEEVINLTFPFRVARYEGVMLFPLEDIADYLGLTGSRRVDELARRLPSNKVAYLDEGYFTKKYVGDAPSDVGGAHGSVGGAPSGVGGAHGSVGGAPSDVGGSHGSVGGAPSDVGGAHGSVGGAPSGVGGAHGSVGGAPSDVGDGPIGVLGTLGLSLGPYVGRKLKCTDLSGVNKLIASSKNNEDAKWSHLDNLTLTVEGLMASSERLRENAAVALVMAAEARAEAAEARTRDVVQMAQSQGVDIAKAEKDRKTREYIERVVRSNKEHDSKRKI
jgi:hypothetical protein